MIFIKAYTADLVVQAFVLFYSEAVGYTSVFSYGDLVLFLFFFECKETLSDVVERYKQAHTCKHCNI